MSIDPTNEADIQKIRDRTWHFLSSEVASAGLMSLDQLTQFLAGSYRPRALQLKRLAQLMGL
jgi:hypothetical protein